MLKIIFVSYNYCIYTRLRGSAIIKIIIISAVDGPPGPSVAAVHGPGGPSTAAALGLGGPIVGGPSVV